MADQDSLAALYARARERGALIDLSDRAKWHLAGADRIRFLNGQVTNDIRRLRPGHAMAACVTTAKGRLCAVIQVSAEADFLRIDTEAELRESLGQRLERYIIADDALLEDTTTEQCLFHLLAPAAPENVPGAVTRVATRFGRPGVDLLAPVVEKQRLIDALAAHVLVPAPLAEVLRIEAGIPRWGAELTGETLPPEAGLDAWAIDYHKGCYIGQEVISRIKSVGHVNRQLTGFTASAPLAAGLTLHPEGQPETDVGAITSAAWSFGLECWAGLGYLKRGLAPGPLEARSAAGASTRVQIRELPQLSPV